MKRKKKKKSFLWNNRKELRKDKADIFPRKTVAQHIATSIQAEIKASYFIEDAFIRAHWVKD